ncbi:hypothetical protein [Amycolatopsis sp. GA6-003]|uniref:hypothetical protein n=1 Tax=Amycolatopsis sp. GA6-003 TaxID=2652444 RepID=UPI003916DC70
MVPKPFGRQIRITGQCRFQDRLVLGRSGFLSNAGTTPPPRAGRAVATSLRLRQPSNRARGKPACARQIGLGCEYPDPPGDWGGNHRFCDVFEIRDGRIQRLHICLGPDCGDADAGRHPWLR